MSDKEQLTELIMRSRAELITEQQAEMEAAYLLENNVRVLPCSVNDMVYILGKFTGQIVISAVKSIYYSENDVFLHLENNSVASVKQQLGETAFLSRVEAEAKFEQLKGGVDDAR